MATLFTNAASETVAPTSDFPILGRTFSNQRLVYLDSASSSQRPEAVIESMNHYYRYVHANVHRGVYDLSEESSAAYELARTTLARFIGATSPDEIVFTKNATEAFNLVSGSWGRTNLKKGEAVLLTEMEHHANLVPWLMLQKELDLELRYIPMDDHGQLILDDLAQLLRGVRLVAVSAASNVLGTLNPVRTIADAAHTAGAVVVVDTVQLAPHRAVDVVALGADFAGITGHKMLGPTGIGALWARRDLLDAMPPFLGGGGMILDVKIDGFTPDNIPHRFEAGTPPIAEAIGLQAAIQYLEGIGMEEVANHERAITQYALESLSDRFGARLKLLGPPADVDRGATISFELEGVHPHDVAQVLADNAVCVRAGHHCAKPLMSRLGIVAVTRASFYVYNDNEDVDRLGDALEKALSIFG